MPGWLEGHMTPGMQGAFQKVWDNRFNRHPVAKKRTQLLLKMSTLEPRLANAPVWILRHMRTDGLLFLCNECPDIATALCRLDNDIDELPMVFASVYKQGVVLRQDCT